MVSYRWSIVTNTQSRTVSGILSIKHLGAMTMTVCGHVTVITVYGSYRCSIVINPLYHIVNEVYVK